MTTGLFLTAERLKYVDFSVSLRVETYRFFLPYPKEKSLYAVFLPFDYTVSLNSLGYSKLFSYELELTSLFQVWLLIVLSFLTVIFLSWLLLRTTKRLVKRSVDLNCFVVYAINGEGNDLIYYII